MRAPLRILLLEDDGIFEDLIAGNLRSSGISCELIRVETRDEFVRELETGAFDLVLADYALPSFDGLSALDIVHARFPQLPFIFVSGAMGEELAIETLQRGATDYVLKHRLSRLTPAVQRALSEARERGEKQQLESQLRQAQKMECLGQLAGGMAHDFGNILSVIYGEMELLSLEKDLTPAVTDAIREVIRCAERGANLTRQLLTLGRNDALELRELDLNTIVENFMRMVQSLLGSRFKLSHELAQTLPRIQAEGGMIEQVLLNLAINARDAMTSGGQICFRTEPVLVDEAYVRAHPQAPAGPAVCLKVIDTGAGIPPDVLPRLFEPFFTTKADGKGTGLGLAMVYGIVKQHRGWIEVESTVGRGTEFRIFFPAAQRAEERLHGNEENLQMPEGTETILLVEEDEQLRAVMRNALEKCGYIIHDCSSGVQAAYAWTNTERIDLLLTDTALPDNLTGWDLARNLLSKQPRLRVIYTSEFSISSAGRDVQLDEGYNFLQKPFGMPYLAQTVRRALDGKSKKLNA
jgi:two-component system, cell cycle sensor histidine kinase and response regulator CckA